MVASTPAGTKLENFGEFQRSMKPVLKLNTGNKVHQMYEITGIPSGYENWREVENETP